MMDVDRLEFKAMLVSQRTQDVQQDDRVDAPRQGEDKLRMRRNVAGKAVRHNTDDLLT